MSSPLCILSQNENLSVSFGGSGFLATYQLGAAQSLLDNAAWILQGAPRVYGASAGSLVAAAVVCGSSLGRVRDQLLEFARFTKQHPLGLLSPAVDIFQWLEVTLRRCLPDNAHTLASGRLHISMTRISDAKNVIVSEFNSSDELIGALLCSCFVPVYSGVIPPQYKGEHYMDGGFTNIQPFEDSSPTLTISAFAGNMDICPCDTSIILCDAIIQQLSFQCSVTNFIRLVDALFPRDWRILKRAFYSGYQDTVYFLQQSNALPLYPQQRKESDASDDSVSSDNWMLTQTDRAEEEESHQNCTGQPAVNGVCSSASPSRQEPTVHKNSPAEVQEVMLCNTVGQLETVSNSDVALPQWTLSYLLLLFTLPIWSASTLWDRYQKRITNAMTVAYWLWHGIKIFMIFTLKIVLSSTRKAFGDMMLSLISFILVQVHPEQHRRRELSERHTMTSSNLNGRVFAVLPPSPSMAQTLPKLYTLLFSLETESKWRRRKTEVQHTLQRHVADVKRN
ncbi:1-acylglycerol-3-phosphate O-acyltransferase Pnpla3-like [Cyprinus carpio]|uniref:1-acylglycerol-3-phosphate O-acyltransferase Pnpla3-like n=1 Tax=Cyprinus carpio TaxID=7962 RepID=A0A9R0AQ32_CYPCA|nr:1-acylglycerol-3-phosphate O-acyltransferase Pnpla3-like [Cyprinus carpio]